MHSVCVRRRHGHSPTPISSRDSTLRRNRSLAHRMPQMRPSARRRGAATKTGSACSCRPPKYGRTRGTSRLARGLGGQRFPPSNAPRSPRLVSGAKSRLNQWVASCSSNLSPPPHDAPKVHSTNRVAGGFPFDPPHPMSNVQPLISMLKYRHTQKYIRRPSLLNLSYPCWSNRLATSQKSQLKPSYPPKSQRTGKTP